MRKIAVVALTLPVVAYGWVVTASSIYLWGTDKLDLFRFPFLQWTQAAPWWRLNWTMTWWVIASAAVPTFVLGLAAFATIRCWKDAGGRSLYGASEWATHTDMTKGGLRIRGRL